MKKENEEDATYSISYEGGKILRVKLINGVRCYNLDDVNNIFSSDVLAFMKSDEGKKKIQEFEKKTGSKITVGELLKLSKNDDENLNKK